jgi:Carboxypeptidase regulatory-like domain
MKGRLSVNSILPQAHCLTLRAPVAASSNKRRIVSVGLVAIVLMPAVTLAQSGIAGIVRDTTAAVLPGVTVEASSPVLLEKTRTAVTDEQGRYHIVDLRPGVYRVAFTLTGFNAFTREGIELTANFTANVNADLRVGALEETVTVSGLGPVVDIQNVIQRSVVTDRQIAAIPTGRSFQNFAQMIPGVSIANVTRPSPQDVGGLSGERQRLIVHGSQFNDFSQTLEGLSFNILNSAGSSTAITVNPGEVQEFSYELGAISAETEKGGARVNIIPKDGGNRFAGSVFAAFANTDMQNDNLTDDLKARGLGSGNPLEKIWDVNPALGGPLVKDKVWFFGSFRYSGLSSLVAGNYYNSTPQAFVYTPDTSRPGVDSLFGTSSGLRTTWQATSKNKISLYGLRTTQLQRNKDIASGLTSPEASTRTMFPTNQLLQAMWSAPVTSRVLFEAGMLVYRFVQDTSPQPGVTPDIMAATEQSTGLRFRANPEYSVISHDQETYRASLSYVTGSHAFKGGFTLQRGSRVSEIRINRDLTVSLLNGVPRSLTMNATPYAATENLDANFGAFVQDQWALRRLTLNVGLRFDQIRASVPEQNLPAVQFVSERNFAALSNVPHWNDLSPRLGASYDLFGTGKTALKMSMNRYVLGELIDFARANNPLFASVNSATRTWTDANRDFNPDCDFRNFLTNGECGPISNTNFGTRNPSVNRYDDAIKEGWGIRGYNWEVMAGIQQELVSGVSANASYFRRWYGNFRATDNRAVTPADYDPYCITAPTDSRLPGGGGYAICGLYDINPSKFGQVTNLVTQANTFGKQTEIYTGIDVLMNARLPRGATLQGGFNTGRVETNSCFVVDSPQALRYCNIKPPFFQPQFKFFGAQPLPRGFQLAGSFQTAAGPEITASYAATSAQIQPSLGRPLAAGANGTVTIPLIQPGTQYGERLYQVDARLTKFFKIGRTRIQGNLDLYNALNSNTVLVQNNTFGSAWQRPTYILPGRLFKVSGQIDF